MAGPCLENQTDHTKAPVGLTLGLTMIGMRRVGKVQSKVVKPRGSKKKTSEPASSPSPQGPRNLSCMTYLVPFDGDFSTLKFNYELFNRNNFNIRY